MSAAPIEGVPAAPPVPVVTPEPDTRLDQLAAEYAALEPLAREYTARIKAIKDAIKAELTAAAPDARSILLRSSYLANPLRLEARSRWTLDAKALKAADPITYVTYAKQGTSWYLTEVAT